MNAKREELLARMTCEEQEILHYGVQGMRWGHHKQQIANVLRKAKVTGKVLLEKRKNSKAAIRKANKKANIPDTGNTSKKQDKAANKKTVEAYKKAYANRSSLSDDDLRKMTQRLKLENELQTEINKLGSQSKEMKKYIAKEVIQKTPDIIKAAGQLYKDVNEANKK